MEKKTTNQNNLTKRIRSAESLAGARKQPPSLVVRRWSLVGALSLRTNGRRPTTLLSLLLLLASCLLFMTRPAGAEQLGLRVRFADVRAQAGQIGIYLNRSVLMQFDETLQRVAVSEPKIAEAVVISPTQVLINGKSIGKCTLIAWSAADPDRPGFFSVGVNPDIEPLVQQAKSLFPSERLAVEQIENRVVLSGLVSSPKVVEAVGQLFDGAGWKVVNLLRAAPAPTKQVMLQVRVAEVNKRALQELGANYSISQRMLPGFIGTNVFQSPVGNLLAGAADMAFSDLVNLSLLSRSSGAGAFIRALQSRNAIRTLAEPNIIALNGQKASFLAGGEFPYPVPQAQGGNIIITIQFREFGVRLNFAPTITDEDHIRLELEPEVSALDFTTGITIAGTRIPGLINRKAKTTLELDDGQSFALAGLMSNDVTRLSAPIPGLSFIPILGYMFRSQRYINNETELVFVCTAHIVKPVTLDQLPPLPGQEALNPKGLEGSFGHSVPAVKREAKQEIKQKQ